MITPSLITRPAQRAWVWILLAAAGLMPGTSLADTTCEAEVAGGLLAFGEVDGQGHTDTSSTVTLSCTTGGIQLSTVVTVRACLSIGAGDAGLSAGAGRRMLNGNGDELRFQIFQNESRSQAWGSLHNPSLGEPVRLPLQYDILLGTGDSASTQVTMYGRVPAQEGLAAGDYQNVFSGLDARLDYRFQQNLFIVVPPTSCTQGGRGGGSVSFPLTASASVPGQCIIESADDLDFGQVPGLINTNVDQTSTVSLTCTNRSLWNMRLDNGLNASGSNRRMRMGSSDSFVNYELYQDPARTQPWGIDEGVDTLTGTGTGNSETVTVYGRVPAGQSVPAGDYQDTVTITVTY